MSKDSSYNQKRIFESFLMLRRLRTTRKAKPKVGEKLKVSADETTEEMMKTYLGLFGQSVVVVSRLWSSNVSG